MFIMIEISEKDKHRLHRPLCT